MALTAKTYPRQELLPTPPHKLYIFILATHSPLEFAHVRQLQHVPFQQTYST